MVHGHVQVDLDLDDFKKLIGVEIISTSTYMTSRTYFYFFLRFFFAFTSNGYYFWLQIFRCSMFNFYIYSFDLFITPSLLGSGVKKRKDYVELIFYGRYGPFRGGRKLDVLMASLPIYRFWWRGQNFWWHLGLVSSPNLGVSMWILFFSIGNR